MGNSFIPPLKEPTTILAWIDRHYLLTLNNPFDYFFKFTLWDLIQSTGNGDVWDTHWYNNAHAAGE